MNILLECILLMLGAYGVPVVACGSMLAHGTCCMLHGV